MGHRPATLGRADGPGPARGRHAGGVLPMSQTLLEQQSALLAALWSPTTAAPTGEAGLPAYQRNARAVAERALAAAYPVLRQCVGEATLAALARDHWLECPPLCGDLACWGAELPDWLSRLGPGHELPAWLPELAQAEWVLHRLATAPDPLPQPGTLARLVQEDPDQLCLEMPAGTQVQAFEAAVISVLLAHGLGDGSVEPSAQALHTQPSLGAALRWLEAHHPGLDLGVWLQEAVTQGLVLAVRDAIPH